MTELPGGAGPVTGIGPGTRLREWEVLSFRGRGSYGVVFEARRSSWLEEPPRALKVFNPIVSSAARHALLGEFSTLTDVEHPHLLRGIDAFDLDTAPHAGCVVFVLELADEDLATRVARLGPLPAEQVAGVGAQVADGLRALHEVGRVHGDVKPENILRVGERWVLGDFGVTGVLEGSYAVTPGATVDYRPPELANAEPGSRLHRSTDVWALGVSLHVAGAGRHPFPGPDPMMRYAAVVRGDRAPAPGFDARLAGVIDDGCLQPDPHRRAGAAELRDRLRSLVEHPVAPDAAAVPPDGAVGQGGPVLAVPPSVPGRSEVPVAPGGTATTRVPAGLVALVATAVVCQGVALVAGALPFELETRRVVYVLVSAGGLATGLEPSVRLLRSRTGRPVPWPALRPLVLVSMVVTWLVATGLLFGAFD